jgi:hypothetical protein
MDEKEDQGRAMLDAFVSGGAEYQSQKRLKMRSILGPAKPDDL